MLAILKTQYSQINDESAAAAAADDCQPEGSSGGGARQRRDDMTHFFLFFSYSLGHRGIVHPLPDGKGTERT